MIRTSIALAALLLSTAAAADTLIDHANGVQVDANGRLQHFTGLLVGDDGKVLRVLHAGDARPRASAVVDARGQTLLPAHYELSPALIAKCTHCQCRMSA